MSTAFICATCGTQHAPAAAPPSSCAICEDPRQWVPAAGQQWTTMDALARRHAIGWREVAPDLLGCGMFPDFGIAQRALLVRTPAGNVLWDCVALLDPATVAIVKALGASAPSPSAIRTTTRRWWNGRAPSTARSCCTPPTVAG